MWTAQIASKYIEKGTLHLGVSYTDGTNTFTEDLATQNSDFEDIKSQILNKVANLNALQTLSSTIGIGNVPALVVTNPTQATIDYNNFQKWMQLVNTLNAAKQMGWITGNEPMVTDIKTKVLALATVNLPKLFS
jgi:hypothetical protein